MKVCDYFKVAMAYEIIFRLILKDLKENRHKRPMGIYVPADLMVDAPLEQIFKSYSEGDRHGVFSITDFEVESGEHETYAIIYFGDVACMSGGGTGLRYVVKGEEVSYLKSDFAMMSMV